MRSTQTGTGWTLGRGVWRMPYRGSGGGVVLLAVTSEGRRVTEVEIFELEGRLALRAEQQRLRVLLDEMDPPTPTLRLVE